MIQAKVYRNKGNYNQVEKIFRQSAEFCSEHETWKLNVAHFFFRQDNKYLILFVTTSHLINV